MKKTVKEEKKATPEMRLVVNKDNTITDRKSGLMIIQDPGLAWEQFQERMTFMESEKAIAELNKNGYAGFKDWRLPTVEEICGIIDRTKYNPCYDTAIFKGKFDDWYWSGDQCAWSKQPDGSYSAAWAVSSDGGSVFSLDKGLHFYVRPVRSCQCQFAPLPVR